MVGNILPADPLTLPLDPGDGRALTPLFFVKLEILCLEWEKNILFDIGNGAEFRPQIRVIESPGWDQQVKSQLFQNLVMLHIKLKGITNALTRQQILCLQIPLTTSPHPGDAVNRSKFNFFQNMVMLHIKLNGITKYISKVANILPSDTPPPDPRNQKV